MEMEITIKIKKDKEEREYELKDGEWVEIDELHNYMLIDKQQLIIQ